eukprot:261184-Amphidinium_carterae.2
MHHNKHIRLAKFKFGKIDDCGVLPVLLDCHLVRRFFDADELTRHMHECHHLCHLCGNMGRHNEFFKTVKALARHYAESHYVCVHKDCSHGGHRKNTKSTTNIDNK